MFNIGPAELIVILLVALLIVGPKRLPEVGKSVGKALREIRRQTDEVRSSFEMSLDDDDDDDDQEPVRDVTASATAAGEAEPVDMGWDVAEWDEGDDRHDEAEPAGADATRRPPAAAEAEPAAAAAEGARRLPASAEAATEDEPGSADAS